MKNSRFFFAVFFSRNNSKFQWFCKFRWLDRKKSHQSSTSFYSTTDIKLIKKNFFQVKKWEIQVVIFMIRLTRSSKRIFNPMRYTGWEFVRANIRNQSERVFETAGSLAWANIFRCLSKSYLRPLIL